MRYKFSFIIFLKNLLNKKTMYTIEESVNEVDELEKIVKKVPFKKNRNISLTKNISRNKTQTFSPINKIYKNKNIKNNFYNFSLSYKEGNSNNKSFNISTSTDNISSQDIFNFHFFHPGNLLFEIFINLSEFDLNKYDFFVSYTNLCGLLREINIIDKKLYTNAIITQNDLDIILKTIKNNNSSKKLNFKEFLKFFSYLVYKIDYLHFIAKPERTLKFNINKLFCNYFKENKMSFISLIYNYVLHIQKEKKINELLNPIIHNLKNIFIKFFQINKDIFKENENILNTNDDNTNKNVSKNKFKYIIDSMKYLGIFPFLVNIKELVIVYNTYLDDNNENEFLEVEDINTDFEFSFKKFCLLFLCLCFYIKNKKQAILKQYFHLLNDNKRNISFETELKYGQKEGIIRFILKLNFKHSSQNDNIYKNNKIKNRINKISEEKFYIEIANLNINDIDFLFQVFESFSSHFDKFLNYQMSFSDMITFLKECGLLTSENKNQNLSLEEKYYKAKNKIKKDISYLKASLYSSDLLFKKNNFNNYNYNSINNLSLKDVEIFYSKVSKRADINNRLNFKEFLKFLYLSLDKLKFKSINDLINALFHKKRNKMFQLMKQYQELEEINKLYDELKTNDVFNIIIQVFPIINTYFLSLTNKINKYIITYDLFIKIFTEFDLYPNLVGNNLLRNIFYKLYQIENDKIKLKEQKLKKIFEDKKEIEFDEILKALGIITLYLAKESDFDEKKILFGLLYRIAESKKIKLELNNNYNFSDAFKNKLIEISNSYFDSSHSEEPKYKLFLKNPYI